MREIRTTERTQVRESVPRAEPAGSDSRADLTPSATTIRDEHVSVRTDQIINNKIVVNKDEALSAVQ